MKYLILYQLPGATIKIYSGLDGSPVLFDTWYAAWSLVYARFWNDWNGTKYSLVEWR